MVWMSALLDPGLQASRGRLAAYSAFLLDEAVEHAWRIHADEVGVEHLLCAIFADEDCAGHRVALHAFADPDTLYGECLALASGILVVGSARAMPFSPRGVALLQAARALAAGQGAQEIDVAHLSRCAYLELPGELAEELRSAGWRDRQQDQGRAADAAPPSSPISVEGPLFKRFSAQAKRALSQAAKLADQGGFSIVSPIHILLGSLKHEDPELSFHRAQMVLRGRGEDTSAPAKRSMAADEVMDSFLQRLCEGASSLDILAACHDERTREVSQLLTRHKVTRALIERSRAAFKDPEPGLRKS
jgi:ATP-dependent Clp protease ATP-binding subunit ClpA